VSQFQLLPAFVNRVSTVRCHHRAIRRQLQKMALTGHFSRQKIIHVDSASQILCGSAIYDHFFNYCKICKNFMPSICICLFF